MDRVEAEYVADLRQRVLANRREGKPAHTGLTIEECKRAVEISRTEYTANQSKSSAAGVHSPAKGPSIDLDSLFTNDKSKNK